MIADQVPLGVSAVFGISVATRGAFGLFNAERLGARAVRNNRSRLSDEELPGLERGMRRYARVGGVGLLVIGLIWLVDVVARLGS